MSAQAASETHPSRPPSLARRLFIANTLVVCAAFLLLALTPLHIKSPLQVGSGGLLSLIGLALVLGTNLAVIRRSLAPLGRLSSSMKSVDLLRPGTRVPVYGESEEVVELTRAFNEMLRRLEDERRDSVRRTLSAQEEERLQLARELHDEIGQTLTALMLQLDYIAKAAPAEITEEVTEAREAARSSLEEVRRIARRLRPEALDDLGLVSAVNHLADRVHALSELPVRGEIERDLPDLTREQELVIYRVAQESLTNVMRHSQAEQVELSLTRTAGGVTLRVADDGRGVDGEPEGAGIKGMRERAVLIGARLDIRPSRLGGTEVLLEVRGDARSASGSD